MKEDDFKELDIGGRIIKEIGFIGRVLAVYDTDVTTPDRTQCRTAIDP